MGGFFLSDKVVKLVGGAAELLKAEAVRLHDCAFFLESAQNLYFWTQNRKNKNFLLILAQFAQKNLLLEGPGGGSVINGAYPV